MKSFVLVLVSLFAFAGMAIGQVADAVYVNGKIYTVNEMQPWAEAVAILDGKFIEVGKDEDIEPHIGDQTKVFKLDGAFAMPGFTDAHLHPVLAYVQAEAGNLLMDATTEDEVKERLLTFSKENPEKKWIRAEKFRFGAFPGGKTNRQWLDAIIPDTPVYLVDESGHNAVVNSKALELASITKDTPQPDGGVIEKDPTTGEPTGYLSETGMSLVGQKLPRIGQEATVRAIEKAFVEFRALGITSFVDMYAYRGSLKAYREIENAGRMTFRISAAIALNDFTDEFDTIDGAAKAFDQAASFNTDLVKVDSFKYWVDGTPLSHTALLLDNYADRPDKGNHTLTQKQLDRVRELLDEGKIGRFHSIGDGTTRMLLDMVEASRKANPGNKQPVHIGHCMLIHEDDLSRFKELNVVAEFSPALWFPLPVNDLLPKYVGSERASDAMPIAAMQSAEATVVIGSDWPAGTPTADPFRGLEGLVTRRDPWGEYPGKIGEPVTLKDAIAMMTLNGTKAMKMSDKLGSIEAGKHADMIVIDQNLFNLEKAGRLDRISKTNVLKTIFAGEVVYDAMKHPKPKTRKPH